MARIHLRHRQFEGLAYGGAGEIQFGLKGGFVPYEWIGDDENPLVTALLAADPEVEIVRPAGPAQVFVCPLDDEEFTTRGALKEHNKTAHPAPKAEKPPKPLAGAAKAAAERKAAKAAAAAAPEA
jgi:hypothetical protein